MEIEPDRPAWAIGLEPCGDCGPGPRPAGVLDVDANGAVEHWDYWQVWLCSEITAGHGLSSGRVPDCTRADVTGDGVIDSADLAAIAEEVY